MRQVPLERLLAILEGHRGTIVVTMVTRTVPRLLAKSRRDKTPTAQTFPLGVEKLSLGRFILANSYRRNVVAQRQREKHPQPAAFDTDRLWAGAGRRLGRFLAQHKESGRLYVVARPQSDGRGNPLSIWTRWINLRTGKDLSGENLEELQTNYLRDLPSANRKQQLRRPIPYRTHHCVSIHSVTVGGVDYAVQ